MGIFWENTGQKSREKTRLRPTIPITTWKKPENLPNLHDANFLTIDIETFDPDLIDNGPGWINKNGYIVGVAIAADFDKKWYFPIEDKINPYNNFDKKIFFNWLKDTLKNEKQPKIGTNLLYDYGWLLSENIEIKGELIDIQFAEALLDETAKVNLDTLAQKYLQKNKLYSQLYQWCSDYYGGKGDEDQRKNIYRAPSELVGPYAESDVDLPRKIFAKQCKDLQSQNLLKLFKRENKLIPLLTEMRKQGVNIDLDKAQKISKKLENRINILQSELTTEIGFHVDIYASASLLKVFDKLKIDYHKTTKGNPSFTKTFLNGCSHPIINKIVEIKELDKIKSVFVDSYLLQSNINGKVHCQFHPLRNDTFGTRSGRFSSSNPNLQNIPSRDKILAPLIRGLFIPDDNHKQWRKYDASQIEYRFLAHYAIGKNSEKIREAYNLNPNTDYHTFTQNLISELTGIDTDRKKTKTINFGIIYGMGSKKLSKALNLTEKDAKNFLETYHTALPFVKTTFDFYANFANKKGYIETISNRRSRFNLFEEKYGKGGPMDFETAVRLYGRDIKRHATHKALNRLLQGSAADLMKEAMLQCYENGVFQKTGIPRLTVHDELCFSDSGNSDKDFLEVKKTFEKAIKINVPVIVNEEIGPNWGETKERSIDETV